MIVNIFIQARMSSSRYPGKVLAPLNGKPLIKHLIDRAVQNKHNCKVVVLTSDLPSDDPLIAYLKTINCSFFRGSLDNVFDRFRNCLIEYPCDYFVRLCGDSPLLEPALMDALVEYVYTSKYDLISNVFGRKFPKGQSVEITKSEVFLNVNSSHLTDYEREHVIPYFYHNKSEYNSLFFEYAEALDHVNMCVDTLEDLKGIEKSAASFQFDRQKLCTTTP